MLKLVAISDTHGKHSSVIIPQCDILVHAGDFTNIGLQTEAEDFMDWFSNQPAKHKVLVAGNHDRHVDSKYNFATGADVWWPELLKKYPGIHYLDNSSVEVEGYLFYGSPETPWFGGDFWGRNVHRNLIHRYWEAIPDNVDVLITHSPPYGKFDKVPISDEKVGCMALADTVLYELSPKYHIFGHIHQDTVGRYVVTDRDTTFVNAALLSNQYQLIQQPIELEL